MITHLEQSSGDWEAPITIVVMRCGEVTLITDDGECHPAMDFVLPPDERRQVDCVCCLACMASDAARAKEMASP
jgi:hypothetical protein